MVLSYLNGNFSYQGIYFGCAYVKLPDSGLKFQLILRRNVLLSHCNRISLARYRTITKIALIGVWHSALT